MPGMGKLEHWSRAPLNALGIEMDAMQE